MKYMFIVIMKKKEKKKNLTKGTRSWIACIAPMSLQFMSLQFLQKIKKK